MMQQAHHSSLISVRVDFMDVCYEVHQQEAETKKKSKAKKRFEARRAIEEHQEQKRLKEVISDWWDDI